MSEVERAMLFKAADLIERRLVKTAGCFTLQAKDLTDYQRGIVFAIRTAQELIREEARRP